MRITWASRSWALVGLIFGMTSLAIAQDESYDNLMVGGPGPHYIRNGSLGIGTTNPAESLEVAGNVRLGMGPVKSSRCTRNIGATDATVPVESTAGYAPSGALLLNDGVITRADEVVTYTGTTPTEFTGVTRGAFGTQAAYHRVGTPVQQLLLVAQAQEGQPGLVVTNGRNVGIGTYSPHTQLEIVGDKENPQPMIWLHGSVPALVLRDTWNKQPTDVVETSLQAYSDGGYVTSSKKLTLGVGSFHGIQLDAQGNVKMTPGATGYFQLQKTSAGMPPLDGCKKNAQRGRMSIDTVNNRLYVCNGKTRGWDFIPLQDF